MASHQPLRQQRKAQQAPPSAQVPMQHNMQPPETSPDPALRDRNRPIKPPTMPPMMFANAANQPPQVQSQNSPGLPGVRRSPPPGQAQRLLPSPPQPSPPNVQDGQTDVRVSPSPTNVNTAYPRPIRGPPAQFLSQFQAMSDNWEMTDEFMAEIETAHLQQAQAQNVPQNLTQSSSHSYSLVDAGTPPKDPPVMDRTRANERTSPKELENAQRRQREQQARESPKNRDRQQNSPAAPTLRNSPDQRISPSYHGEAAPAYSQYTRDSPQVARRQTLPESRAVHTIASQSPPTQSINRIPDRSLPVQEEAEDEPATISRNRDSWKDHPHSPEQQQRHAGSPTPSSDLNPDGNGQRYDGGSHSGIDARPIQRNDNDALIHLGEVDPHRSPDEDDSYTPRSPTAGLPDDPRDKYYNQQSSLNGGNMRTVRARGRNSASDSLGLRTLDQVFDQPGPTLPPTQDLRTNPTSPQYEQRRPAQPKPSAPIANLAAQVAQAQPQSPPPPSIPSVSSQPQPQPTPALPPHIQPKPQRVQELRGSPYAGYYDFQHFLEDPASAYIHAYLSSPRPDAPIPPTPHSQTAAPSPSPLLSGMFESRDMPPFSPIAPVGSPYPYPFTHVRRPPAYSSSSRGHQLSSLSNSGLDPNVIQEQMVRQWQIYAQNNNNGHMTDSTFSPSTTPFQNAYNPWAFLHTSRTLGGGRLHPDAMSMQSSPSHEPVPLPSVPTINRRREREREPAREVHRERDHSNLRNQVLTRKPPPRVESTQPRDTSPEPTSSEGEETAGEETYSVGGDGDGDENENGHLHPHHHHPPRWMNGSSGSGGSGSTSTEHGGGGGVGLNNGVTNGHHIYGHTHSHSTSNSVTTVVADSEDNEEDWVDEADDDDDDLLELEYHPSYVSKEDKRRRKWEVGWEALSQAFSQLDRQTDATMILMAAPSHTSKLYSLRSRFIRRDPGSPTASQTNEIRSAFRKIAAHRRTSRTQRASLRDRILSSSLGSHSEAGTPAFENEVELRRALDTALASLDALGNIYDQREARWVEEMRRLTSDRERVELLLKQVVGSTSGYGIPTPVTPNGFGLGLGFVPPVTVMPPPPS
ncbi:hypothetical protein BDN72DRAFT_802733 [Pluteus cervinus]|uniref:Uncharacterized protein n=1 Tax=Pluteus cervinus TaxID=181527 RepID=A0ACD3AE91_9AGAR|nr:hypothetical protein BDN72DRAFT_802733 [Pluteus cervinus]